MNAPRRRRVVVVGGGIAALEAVLALHDVAGDRLSVTVIAPDDEFSLWPLAVASPFGLGPAGELRWTDVMAEHDGRFVQTAVTKVDPRRRAVLGQSGDEIPYDQLVLAPGTHAVPALPSSITLDARRPSTVAAVAKALELGWSRAVAFVVPGGCTWPLPLYEFALLIADRVGERYGVALHVVTPEPTPLAVFGEEASAALLLQLEDRGIIFHGGVTTRLVDWHALEIGAPMPLRVDHIIALPTMHGPGLAGIPADPDGFIPIDRWCRVTGLDGVWAAGDGTDQPIKQGGIACQQADAIAAQIAAGPNAGEPAESPDLVLRARLLTGSSDLYLRHTVGSDDSEASFEPLWSPPAKVVGRHLVPYLERKGISDRGTAALPCGARP